MRDPARCPPASAAAAAEPNPPRYRWLKRSVMIAAAVLVAVAGLRVWTGHRAQARLDAAVAAIRGEGEEGGEGGEGEALLVEDLRAQPLPVEENRVTHLKRAWAEWPTVPGRGVTVVETDWWVHHGSADDPPPDPIPDDAAYLASLSGVLADLRRAEEASGTDWGVRITRPIISIQIPHLGDSRRLMHVIDDAADRAAAVGDAGLALELLRLQFVIAEANFEGQPRMRVTGLVAVSIQANAIWQLEKLLPGLALDAGSRDEARRLLAVLLDDAAFERGQSDAWIGGRAMDFDAVMWIVEGRGSGSGAFGWNTALDRRLSPVVYSRFGRVLFRPLMVEDARRTLTESTRAIDAVRGGRNAASRAEVRRLGERLDEEAERLESRARYPLTLMHAPVFEAMLRTETRLLMARRLAAVALAIKLYEAEHGRRPATLAELVPTYLPAVPRDPMRADGGPVRYRPDEAVLVPWQQRDPDDPNAPLTPLPEPGPAIVYSVGLDGIDQGGVIFVGDDGTPDPSAKHSEGGDMYFLLDPPPESRE